MSERSEGTAVKVGSKAEKTRQRILAAGAAVVGREGYDKASITKITAEAGIAAGLFYYYFPSREGLLEQLLPSLGRELIDFIGKRVRKLAMGAEREVASFVAYFDFLALKPEFYRIFSEAQVYTPRAYDIHFRLIIDNYVYALRQQRKAGFITMPDADLAALAYSLTGVRNYLTQMLAKTDPAFKSRPRNFVRIYRRFLADGIFKE
jgi:AcrR family transcriptional regulator